jgi:ABC-type multidrug transport system permease subunit
VSNHRHGVYAKFQRYVYTINRGLSLYVGLLIIFYQNANSTTVRLYYCITAAATATTAIIIIIIIIIIITRHVRKIKTHHM